MYNFVKVTVTLLYSRSEQNIVNQLYGKKKSVCLNVLICFLVGLLRRVKHNAEKMKLLHLTTAWHWRRKWQPPQDSCWENPMDRGVRRATVYGVAESDTTELAHRALW